MIAKPMNIDPNIYYESYISAIPEADLVLALENSIKDSKKIAELVTPELENYAYAEGKWTIKQLFQHMVDCERLLSYRVLSLSRNEKGRLLGFDEDEYVKFDGSDQLSLSEIMTDFELARKCTISLIKSIPSTQLDLEGNANGTKTSARIIAWFMAGHQNHHNKILMERYIGKS